MEINQDLKKIESRTDWTNRGIYKSIWAFYQNLLNKSTFNIEWMNKWINDWINELMTS